MIESHNKASVIELFEQGISRYKGFWEKENPGSILFQADQYRKQLTYDWLGVEMDNLSSFYREYVDGQLEYLDCRIWGRDDAVPMITPPYFGVGILATAFGAKYDAGNNWTEPGLGSADEISDLKMPTLSDGLMGKVLDGIEYTVGATGGDIPIQLYDSLQGPLSTACMVLGSQELMTAMYTHPDHIHHLMDMATELTIQFINAASRIIPKPVFSNLSEMFFPKGSGVCLADDLASVVSPKLYEEFCVPYMNRISDAFDGIMLHSCGDMSVNFDALSKIRNLRAIDFGITECSLGNAMEYWDGSIVLITHIGLNAEKTISNRMEFVERVLEKCRVNASLYVLSNRYMVNVAQPSLEEKNETSERIIQLIGEKMENGGKL